MSLLRILLICCLFFFLVSFQSVEGKESSYIVKIVPSLESQRHDKLMQLFGSGNISWLSKKAGLLKIKTNKGGSSIPFLPTFFSNFEILYVEPDYKRSCLSLPNDPLLPYQWGLGMIGFLDLQATDVKTENIENIIVGILDTGVDFNHSDLRPNLWINTGEDWIDSAPGHNGIDDDGDGYVDNYFGVNIITSSGNPLDDNGHGTAVAGIIGAVCANGAGICGVANRVKIMAFKIFDAQGEGSVADFVKAVDYLIDFKRRTGLPVIINASFGGPDYSLAEKEILELASREGILVITASGNKHSDNDMSPVYPANYNLPNIISVAAVEEDGYLAPFSNWGKKSVDLGAPGVNIFTTLNNGGYGSVSGTSFAAAFVSGASASLLSICPSLGFEISNYLMEGVTAKYFLEGRLVTGGILNLKKSLSHLSQSQILWKFELKKGLNLVSFPISCCSFEEGKNVIKAIWTFKDGRWLAYFPEQPGFSNIKYLREGDGYWLEVENDALISIRGVRTNRWPKIGIGWNLVGFPIFNTCEIQEVISQHYVDVAIESIWAYQDGDWKAYFPANPDLSDLEFFEPGRGYWIRVGK